MHHCQAEHYSCIGAKRALIKAGANHGPREPCKGLLSEGDIEVGAVDERRGPRSGSNRCDSYASPGRDLDEWRYAAGATGFEVSLCVYMCVCFLGRPSASPPSSCSLGRAWPSLTQKPAGLTGREPSVQGADLALLSHESVNSSGGVEQSTYQVRSNTTIRTRQLVHPSAGPKSLRGINY